MSRFIALKLLFIKKNHRIPPPFDHQALLKELDDVLTEDDKKWINELIETRIKDRNAHYTMTLKFRIFLDEAMLAKPVIQSSMSDEEIDEALEGLTN